MTLPPELISKVMEYVNRFSQSIPLSKYKNMSYMMGEMAYQLGKITLDQYANLDKYIGIK